MKFVKHHLCDQNGSVLMIAVIMLVALSLLGIFAITTSNIEIQIAANDKRHKIAFVAADGGIEATKELIEQVIEQRGIPSSAGGMGIHNSSFILNTSIGSNIPSDTNRDLSIPATTSSGVPHTNILVGGNTSLSSGNALQMVAGYEGKGKGAAGGGGKIVYDIRSQHIGRNNSRAMILGRWRHVI